MNLIGNPWIPIKLIDGTSSLVGLRELYENIENICELDLPPHQYIAIMRLLLCITQAALDGPEDEAEWFECKPDIIPQSLKYLESRHSKFDLYGETPFLQVKDLEKTNNANVDKLDFKLASGNSHTLFDHGATKKGRVQTDSWIALMLLTYQCFSPAGLMGTSTWNSTIDKKSSCLAPAIEQSPIHTFITGENLLKTLHYNLMTKASLQEDSTGTWGNPIWDDFPTSYKDPKNKQRTRSYLGRLVPLSRAILLNGTGTPKITLVNGLTYPPIPEYQDPVLTIVTKEVNKKKTAGYLSLNPSKHIWRDLQSILLLNNRNNKRGPLALKRIPYLETDSTITIWAGGIKAKQAKFIDACQWNITIPLNLLKESTCIDKYGEGIRLANSEANHLQKQINEYLKKIAPKNPSLKTSYTNQALTHFWTLLDKQHQTLLAIAGDTVQDLKDWKDLLWKARIKSYEQTCPHETPRQICAFVQGKSIKQKKT